MSIAVPHRRLAFLRRLTVLRKGVKGHSPRRSRALQAAGGPGGVWRIGHFPGPGVCEGFRIGNARAVRGPVDGGGVEGYEGEDEVGEEEHANSESAGASKPARSIFLSSREVFRRRNWCDLHE